MRDSFVTPVFVLDLRDVKMSFVEQNPMFKDSFSTKYSFPFEFHLNKDLKILMGDYSNMNADGLRNKYEGYHVFEGKANRAVLEILEVEGNVVRAQIDSGFDELPNFQKKLSELPFERIEVPDIYEHAESVFTKKYPEVNYNFPVVRYDKHSPDENGWEIFNQFLNDRRKDDTTGVYSFVTNNEKQQDGVGTFHKNRNIIHPMPYLLYVLKTGFLDAGFELTGDILEDIHFKQCVVYSATNNYSEVKDQSINFVISAEDIIETNRFGRSTYKKTIILKETGKYFFQGDFNLEGYSEEWGYSSVAVFLNSKLLVRESDWWNQNNNFNLSFHFVSKSKNEELTVQLVSKKSDRIYKPIVTFESFLNSDGDVIFQIHNENLINIQRVVPDMTFGELVTTLKNWRNYDLKIEGSKVVMNRLRVSSVFKMKDFSTFLRKSPIKVYSEKRSFNIVFPEMDEEKDSLNNIFINENGVKLGGAPQEETTELKINGYPLPAEYFKGVLAAAIKLDSNSVLSLIYYNGDLGGTNSPLMATGLLPQVILPDVEEWFKMRIESTELKWDFIVNKNKFRHIKIRDILYAYNKRLWIKEITRNVLNERYYQVSIVTETIN